MRHSPNPQTRIQPSRLCLGGASAGRGVGDSPQGDVGCWLVTVGRFCGGWLFGCRWLCESGVFVSGVAGG